MGRIGQAAFHTGKTSALADSIEVLNGVLLGQSPKCHLAATSLERIVQPEVNRANQAITILRRPDSLSPVGISLCALKAVGMIV